MKGHWDQARLFTKLLVESFADRLISVVLFGSVARGGDRTDSDIDLMVVLKGLPAGRYSRRSQLDPIFDRFEQAGGDAVVNCHLKTPDEAGVVTVLYCDFVDHAKLLFDRDDFFQQIIEGVSERIRKSGAVRKKWGRSYYWDLKPGAHADEVFDIL